MSVVQVIGRLDSGISLDTVTISRDDEERKGCLDITHAAQAWSLWPRLNRGLKLKFEGCQSIEITKTDLEIISTETLVRHKRSTRSKKLLKTKRTRKKRRRRNLCRRQAMRVDRSKLAGFDFIFMPRHFNAAMCSGICSPR